MNTSIIIFGVVIVAGILIVRIYAAKTKTPNVPATAEQKKAGIQAQITDIEAQIATAASTSLQAQLDDLKKQLAEIV